MVIAALNMVLEIGKLKSQINLWPKIPVTTHETSKTPWTEYDIWHISYSVHICFTSVSVVNGSWKKRKHSHKIVNALIRLSEFWIKLRESEHGENIFWIGSMDGGVSR